MNNRLSHFLLLALAASSMALADDFANKYFGSDNPKLTPQEKAAMATRQKWQQAGSVMAPIAGQNGVVKFVFGAQQPSIVCAVLQVCDIALQAGEQVNSIQLGDTARWTIEPAISGSGATETQHIVIKPMDVGLETSLFVTTDRRSYHIKLRSHRTDYMPQVAFTYPDETLAKWEAINKKEKEDRQKNTMPTGEYLGDLSFDYQIDGAVSWKPSRVYNDGKKTVIEMPKTMGEAPTLLTVRKDGGLFSDPDTEVVNYRVQEGRYIVDSVFEKAIMVVGVGSQQERVTITRKK